MIKRILPIYHTGWFYLLLLFWGFSCWSVAVGELTPLNQLNLHWLTQFKQSSTLEHKQSTTSSSLNSALKNSDILTLQSRFNEQDINSVTTLLSYYPDSQITLLGQQSNIFMIKLAEYLASLPRKNKVVINSSQITSAAPLKPQATMTFSSLLNWFRFSAKTDIETSSSSSFIFTPFLTNQRQNFPLVWLQQGKMYLTLPGEILRQLNSKTELLIKQSWQLTLVEQENSLSSVKLPLGFFGEVFITQSALNQSQLTKIAQEKSGYRLAKTAELNSVNQFITQRSLASQSAQAAKYKLIIITDNTNSQDQILTPLLTKLTQHDYLYQSLLTLLSAWLLLFSGLILTWFIRALSLKKQLACVLTYLLLLFILQYFLFNQQQWLEVMPIIMVTMGTWLLLMAYQKEYRRFIAALNYQLPLNNVSPSSATVIAAKKISVSGKKNSQAQQVQEALGKDNLVKARLLVEQSPTNPHQISQRPALSSTVEEDLEQTLVILEQPLNKQMHSQAKINHHISVENFGRYQVEGILGKGAMGIVYQGVDPKINRHVAIKTLQLSDDIDSPEFTEAKARFFREAQTAGGLSHANIVTIYDVGEDNNLGYIAMDLLTGAPLSLFTQPGQTLPTPLVYQLLIQITDALDYAHRQNVVHRDIKPANIIYDDDLLKVTVTDFGIAYVSDNSKTRTGIIMGSPYYMSPEQILGLKVDGRSDIFSLGVTFYQLLCGHLPFEGESIATVAYQITKAKAIAVNQRNTKLPTSALRICNKAMHKDIDKRYQSMAEFKLALMNALKRDFKVMPN